MIREWPEDGNVIRMVTTPEELDREMKRGGMVTLHVRSELWSYLEGKWSGAIRRAREAMELEESPDKLYLRLGVGSNRLRPIFPE